MADNVDKEGSLSRTRQQTARSRTGPVRPADEPAAAATAAVGSGSGAAESPGTALVGGVPAERAVRRRAASVGGGATGTYIYKVTYTVT